MKHSSLFRQINQFKQLPIVRENSLLLLAIGICLLVFVVQKVFPASVSSWEYGAIPFLIQHAWDLMVGNVEGELKFKPFFTLITTIFLHGDVKHLLSNLPFLWLYGALTNQVLGQKTGIWILFITGSIGAVTHLFMNFGSWMPLIGASGAVMGYAGAYFALALKWQLPDPSIWPLGEGATRNRLLFLIGLYFLLDVFSVQQNIQSNIAYGAHIGGFLSGAFLGSILLPKK